MELYLQFGAGMMAHSVHLLKTWQGGTIVLSPRDLDEKRCETFSEQLSSLRNVKTLFDPQLYLPRSNHKRLCSYSYWPSDYTTGAFWQGTSLKRLIDDVIKLNGRMSTDAIILPGLLASQIDDDWLSIQSEIIRAGLSSGVKGPFIATIALRDEVVIQEAQIAKLLEATENWKVSGCYIVVEHPRGSYLVDNPVWTANVLDLIAGLRMIGVKVILGYCNHQMLVAACAKANALCSGTFMNVRSFPPEKFEQKVEEDGGNRSPWFYCPQTLSEYKDTYLDIAHRIGVLDELRPELKYGGYTNRLFSGVQPTTLKFKEQDAFRHYLHALHVQAAETSFTSFDETVKHHQELLTRAENILYGLREAGIRGQQRDFYSIVDSNRAALASLMSTRGAILRRRWCQLD